MLKRRINTMAITAVISLLLFSTAIFAEDISQILNPSNGKVLHVSIKTGKNKNPGTAEKPMKNIDKAIKKAKSGDTIAVAEGIYMGTFKIGYLETKIALKFYGGFSTDFKARDMIKHATLIQPDNKSGAKSRKPLLRIKSETDGTVVDGFIFDMGMRNSYHAKKGKPEGVETGMLLLPPAKASGQKPTVTESCISIPSAAKAGSVRISNNVFANCAKFGIQGGIRGGKYEIVNNIFIANRMASIEIYGTCAKKRRSGPKDKPRCGEIEIAYNTVLFSWSRTKDFQDMGYGISVMTKAAYNIHHNLIGASIMTGVNNTRFTKDEWIKLDNNKFFVNKVADLEYSPESNTILNLSANEFEDLEFASVEGNLNAIPKGLTVDKAYLSGFLSARYTEKVNYNPESDVNQLREMLGINKQGKIKSKVSMYANRYPWKKAVALFGALKDAGAQMPK